MILLSILFVLFHQMVYQVYSPSDSLQISINIKVTLGGTRVTHAVKHLTLDFGSGNDLEIKPCIGLHPRCGAFLRSLSLPHPHSLSLLKKVLKK